MNMAYYHFTIYNEDGSEVETAIIRAENEEEAEEEAQLTLLLQEGQYFELVDVEIAI
jgi:hypothetical protein